MKRNHYLFVRLALAAIFLIYALAKFTGSQFSRLQISDPLNQVDPITLVWYFFGYSQAYGLFIASGQVVAAILTALTKTFRFGLVACFGLALNIAVLDWCFGFPLPATLLATALAVVSLILIIAERRTYALLLQPLPTPSNRTL